jgi:hypothetical protein
VSDTAAPIQGGDILEREADSLRGLGNDPLLQPTKIELPAALTTARPIFSLENWINAAGLDALSADTSLSDTEAALIALRERLPADLDALSRRTLRQTVLARLRDRAVPHSAAMVDAALGPVPRPTNMADDRPRRSQATLLISLARDTGAEFFHDDDQAYVLVRVKDHRETYPLRSKLGRAWLQGLLIDATEKCASSQAIADATNALEALALRGPEYHVYVRIAVCNGAIYIDLGDPTWRVVEITEAGWRVVLESRVRFRRPRGLMALPEPKLGGTITALRPFVNLTDDDFTMLVAWLLAALRGRGPYPVLVLNGEQGSAKSTLSRIIKALLDPNLAPLRGEPREPRDLMIAAVNNHVLAFDNLSYVRLSDELCRLATGGGFSTRTLYENREEEIFDAVRPVVLNGIAELATRPDLVSRAVCLHPPPIRDDKRRDEAVFWADFERTRPQILGALLTIVGAALAAEADVRLDAKPRMADFAVWIVAAEPACPWRAGDFMNVYAGNRQQAIEANLDGDPLGDLVRGLAAEGWTGTAKELLDALNKITPEATQRQNGWFKRPRQVSDALRRLAPALRSLGVDVVFGKRTGMARPITIRTQSEQRGFASSRPSPASTTTDSQTPPRDAGCDLEADSSRQGAGLFSLRDARDEHDAREPVFSDEGSNDLSDPFDGQ